MIGYNKYEREIKSNLEVWKKMLRKISRKHNKKTKKKEKIRELENYFRSFNIQIVRVLE